MQREGIIEKVVYGGYSLLREDDRIVFLDNGYPGEKVRYTITREKKNLAFGKVEEIVSYSNSRTKPLCKYFKECVGCTFMDVKYSFQLQLKREIIVEQLNRIAKMDPIEVDKKVQNVIKMNDPYYYRNKVELSVKNGRVGYISKDKELLEIDECKIASKKINGIIKILSKTLQETPNFNIRHIIIKSTSTGEAMVDIVVKSPLKSNQIIKALKPKANSIFITSKNGWKKLVHGEGIIHEEMENLTLLVKPKSFFQVNLNQLKNMVSKIKEIIKERKITNIVDAYGGMGIFSLILSSQLTHSIVVDISKDSISAGFHTAKMNRIKNVEYVNLAFEDFEYPKGYDLLVDPPREGLSNEVLNKIEKVGPEKILYISCNLATFSRDLAKLLSFGYNMQDVIPFDMFPHTYHVETLTLLTKQEVIK